MNDSEDALSATRNARRTASIVGADDLGSARRGRWMLAGVCCAVATFFCAVGSFGAPIAGHVSGLAVTGLCLGSFLNVVAHRLPQMLEAKWRRESQAALGLEESSDATISLSRPASRCCACGAPIAPWHNVPILSYLWLRGRCAACRSPIGLRYPVVEAVTALLWGLVGWHFAAPGQWPQILAYGTLLSMLLVLAMIDADTQLLPDALTVPLLWLGLLASLLRLTVPLEAAVAGAMAGYAAMWGIAFIYRLTAGQEGMGAGDFKLVAALGAWLGWQSLPLIVVLGASANALVGSIILLRRRGTLQTPLPFGPYLIGAAVVVLPWGDDIRRICLNYGG